jgi:hypothetical protein
MTERHDIPEFDSLQAQIADCHRQIGVQCERLERQVKNGREPKHTRAILLCLQSTVLTLTKLRNHYQERPNSYGDKRINARVIE